MVDGLGFLLPYVSSAAVASILGVQVGNRTYLLVDAFIYEDCCASSDFEI